MHLNGFANEFKLIFCYIYLTVIQMFKKIRLDSVKKVKNRSNNLAKSNGKVSSLKTQ